MRRALGALAVSALAAAGPIAFPRDHGAHPDVPLEWWYWTGHLQGAAGREYGFQLTFFRLRDVHLAHFAWSDVSSGRFSYEEKVHLALPGIAGSSEKGLDVFNEDWSAREEKGTQKLRARTREGPLTLTLSPAKAPVLHGEAGLSRKGPGPDEYSSYVSITRLNVSGTLERDGKPEALTGKAWFDHEWGPGGLPAGIGGWDWFALVLDDGSELMLYRMRRTDGQASPFSAGTYVPASVPSASGFVEGRPSRGEDDLDLAPIEGDLSRRLGACGRVARPRGRDHAAARRPGARDDDVDQRDVLGRSLPRGRQARRPVDRRSCLRRDDRLCRPGCAGLRQALKTDSGRRTADGYCPASGAGAAALVLGSTSIVSVNFFAFARLR